MVDCIQLPPHNGIPYVALPANLLTDTQVLHVSHERGSNICTQESKGKHATMMPMQLHAKCNPSICYSMSEEECTLKMPAAVLNVSLQSFAV